MTNIAVICFGRMNPPTKGHELLIQKVVSTAKRVNGDHYVFLTQTEDSKNNPLPWDEKVRYAKALFPGVNISVNQELRTLVQILEKLGEEYDEVYLVVGEDRVKGFRWIYNYLMEYNLNEFHIIVAGERDPDANDIAGVSASGAREAVRNGDFATFAEMIPDSASFALKQHMFDKLKTYIIK